MKDFTLILGGGGVWGVAWMTGLVQGLAQHGLDLSSADAFIGTSAGSIVSAQLALSQPTGVSIETLYLRQTEAAPQLQEMSPAPNLEALGVLLRPSPTQDRAARVLEIGRVAMQATTMTYAQRRANISERLGLAADTWPTKRLLITAVDCEGGELRAFDSASGANLVDAVAASTAVPGIYPPAPIDGRHYMDGGVWKTPENAHLAKGARRVVILSPVGTVAPSAPQLMADIELLERSGARVALIAPDAASTESQSLGLLSPASRKPAAEAGRAQAASVVGKLSRI